MNQDFLPESESEDVIKKDSVEDDDTQSSNNTSSQKPLTDVPSETPPPSSPEKISSKKEHAKFTPPKQNIGSIIMAIATAFWLGLSTVLVYFITWFVEQIMIATGFEWPIWRWPTITFIYALITAAPVWVLAISWREPRYRAVFQTWAVASFSIFFLLFVKAIPINATQLANVVQLISLMLYLTFIIVLIRWRQRRSGISFIKPQGPYWIYLLVVPIFSCGWLMFGALGSVLDTFLNGLVALLFGLSVGLIMGHFLLPALRLSSDNIGWNMWLGGGVMAISLLLMGAALGFNGSQLLLMVMLPPLGWVLMGFSQLTSLKLESTWLGLALFIGLVVAAPLSFADPDELGLLQNASSLDVLGWSWLATCLTVLSAIVLGIVLHFLRKRILSLQPTFFMAAVATMWFIGLLAYIIIGQPGFYGDRYFVILKDQADVSAAVTLDDYVWRRQSVYNKLVKHANTTQADLRATFDSLGLSYTPYYLVNAIEVEANPFLLWWLNTQPEVDRVLDSIVLRPLPAPASPNTGNKQVVEEPLWNLTNIGADKVWAEFNVTGQGIIIGQSDTGVESDHLELKNSYRGKDGNQDYNWFDPWYHSTEPTDISGHGTHTLGSIVGENVGVAPGSTWYACANLARSLGNPALYLDCMQFMLAPFPLTGDPFQDGDPSLGAHVINNSWGCPTLEGCDPNALLPAVAALRAAGVFVVASAGNEGDAGCETVAHPPALYDEAFSVGAVDEWGEITSFSSRGPVTVDGSNRTKPDIMAPGGEVLSAYPDNTYFQASGTSMAGPHVVGVVALMWSANPALIGDIDLTEQILIETATPYNYSSAHLPNCATSTNSPNNAVGYGTVNAYEAVKKALSAK